MKTKDFESIKIAHAKNGIYLELKKHNLKEPPLGNTETEPYVFTSMVELYAFLTETIVNEDKLDYDQQIKFIECEACSEKLGMPTLCKGCLNNRQAILNLERGMINK